MALVRAERGCRARSRRAAGGGKLPQVAQVQLMPAEVGVRDHLEVLQVVEVQLVQLMSAERNRGAQAESLLESFNDVAVCWGEHDSSDVADRSHPGSIHSLRGEGANAGPDLSM